MSIRFVVTNLKLFLTNQGASLIHLAAKFDQLEVVEWLLEVEGEKVAKLQTLNGATCNFQCFKWE